MSDQTIRFSDEERDLVASFLGISTLKVRGVEFLLNLKESERRAEIDALLAEEAVRRHDAEHHDHVCEGKH